MCGIVGILAFGTLSGKKQEKLRQEAMIFLSSELLQLTQTRGKDATGIATMFSDCEYMGLKMGIPSTEFVARFGGTEKDFDGYLNVWRKRAIPAKMVLGHCRKSSVGNPENNINNHPIKVKDIIGVHNGTLTNHDKIFELLKCDRNGTVDSEAIFRLLHHLTNNGKEPFAPEVIQEVCKRLHGTYACLAFAGNNPYQMVGFRDSRPMEALLIKPLKLLLIASDKDFLKHVIFRYNKTTNLYQTGTIKFPPLKKTDVELHTLPDDHLYIFDIRKEVEDTSVIKDLFISERTPRVDKIWDTGPERLQRVFGTKETKKVIPAKYSYYQDQGQNQNVAYLNKKSALAKQKDKNKSRLGMAWNKGTKSYQEVTNLEVSRDYPNVKIDLESGKVINTDTEEILIKGKIENSPIQQFNLKRSYGGIDLCKVPQATVKELIIPVKNLPVIVNSCKTEVTIETDPDALEKAIVATQKEENFNNNREVQLALEIEKSEHLECLTTYTLANRIKKFFYKKGWYNGYVCGSHEPSIKKNISGNSTSKNMIVRINNKRKLAEKHIRVMKDIVRIFSYVTTSYGVTGSDGEVGEVTINEAVKKTLTDSNEINVDFVKSIFKPGDFKNIPVLKKIVSSIKLNKQGR